MKHGIILLATALLICSCKNEESIYPVVYNQYRYINDDEVPFRTGTPDELDGKTLIVNNFSFTTPTHASASFCAYDIYKTSDSTISFTTHHRFEYYEYEQIGNDVYMHNDSISFSVKAKKNCIIFNDTVYPLATPLIVIEFGNVELTDEP